MNTPLTSLKPLPVGAKVRQLVEYCAKQAEQDLRAMRQRGYGGHMGTLGPVPEQTKESSRG